MTGGSRRAAVLGSPIVHSLSPALHRAAYRSLNLPWRYDAIECDEIRLPGLLADLAPDPAWAGFSLTMPLKRAVLPLLAGASDAVRAIGACNTLIRDGDGWDGENTDAPGMVAALREAGVSRMGAVTILGAGGTAAAALAACRDLHASTVTVVVRDPARTADLRAASERLGVGFDVATWPGAGALAAADTVVSTLPAHAADTLDVAWRAEQALFDVVYASWPTALATSATDAGARVVGGLDLLVHQAALQVELMTGHAAPVAAMREAGVAALRESVEPDRH